MNTDAIEAFGRHIGVYAFMNTRWGWPFIESVHFIALATLLGTIGLFDLRALGIARGVSIAALHRLAPFGASAYAVNVFTGSLFFVSAPDQYLFNPSFQLKLLCMLVAGLNIAIFYSLLANKIKTLEPDAIAPLSIKIVAAVSLTCWIGVIIFGRLITYFRPPYYWCFWC